MDKIIELRVQGLTSSQIQNGAYALILAEENGLRRVPIVVGTAEAQSIAIALENINPPRPLTHDLFTSFAKSMKMTLEEVFIYRFEDGVFYSELRFTDEEGHKIKLDSRTSDAIAIALRMKCPIFIYDSIVQECGVVLDNGVETNEEDDETDDMFDDFGSPNTEIDPDDLAEEDFSKWLILMDDKELQERLELAIAEEDYELAKKYKDEQLKRETQEDNK